MAGQLWDAPNQEVVRAVEEGGAPDPEVGAFNPGDHTVEDVKAYVEAHPDDADEVYEAELAGKARTTLLDWFAEV